MSGTKSKITAQQVKDAIAEHGSQVKAAVALGINRNTIRSILDREAVRPTESKAPLLEKVSDIIYMDKKNPKDMTFQDVIDGFVQAQGFRGKFDFKQFEATINVKSKSPISLSFISDVHIGSQYVNYQAVLEDAELVKKSPNMYVMLGGDVSDKMNNFRNSAVAGGQLHPVTIQVLTEEKYIDFLGNKLLAKIGGNHDKMDSKMSGMDSNYFINRGKKYPFLPHGGLIKINVGKAEYKILWKHQYRFKSSLNQFNSHHRMLGLLDPTADIVVQEHEHSPGIESLEKGEYDKKTVVNIRTGAYKINDGFSMDFYKSGRTAPQTIILFPDEKKILAMHGRDAIKDAITYLEGYRAQKRK